MLQRLTGRAVTRRNLSLAISSLRVCTSVQVQDAVDAGAGWSKQEPLFSAKGYRSLACSQRDLSLFFQCIHSADGVKCKRSSDFTSFLTSYGRRSCSNAVVEQSLEQTSVTLDPPSEALQRYLMIVRICEILETQPWGEETAKRLEGLDVPFTSDMVIGVVRAVSSPTSSLNFFKWLTSNSFEQDVHTYAAMLDVLGEAGSLEDMKLLMVAMCEAGLVADSCLYDRLIHWCVHHGDSMGASSFLEKMKEEGLTLSASTYTSMLGIHVKEAKYEDAVTLYLQMVEESVLPSSETLTLLVRCLLEAGKLESAQKIYESLPDLKLKPSPSMFAYLMLAYAKVGNLTLLKSLGKEMRNTCWRPGEVFCVALASLQKEGKYEEADSFAKEVWPELTPEERSAKAQSVGSASRSHVRDGSELQNDLEHLICADRKVRVALSETVKLLESEGLSVFQQMKVDWTPDTVYKTLSHLKSSDLAWDFFRWARSATGYIHDIRNELFMLRVLVKGSKFPTFKELLSDIQSRDALPLEIFNTLIKDCATVKNARAAMWVYSRIKESGLQPDAETFSLLVQAFARGRNPDKASDLCFVMQDVGLNPDVETYTAVIHSLGLAGRTEDAWSVYQRMLAVGLKPNAHAYTALLNMMNIAGDTKSGIKIFKEMNSNGVSPSEATQGIMARIWEAAGNSAESEKLETQRKFLLSKRRENSLQHIYGVLLEGLVEQERSPSLSSFS